MCVGVRRICCDASLLKDSGHGDSRDGIRGTRAMMIATKIQGMVVLGLRFKKTFKCLSPGRGPIPMPIGPPIPDDGERGHLI